MCEKDDRNVVMGLIICSKTVTLQLQVQKYFVIKEESKISLKFEWNCDDQQITPHVGWGCTGALGFDLNIIWNIYNINHVTIINI